MAHKATGTHFYSHFFLLKKFWAYRMVCLNLWVKSLRKGLVMECSTDEEGVEPAVVAQKIYFWTFDKNLTESELINTVKDPKMVYIHLFWRLLLSFAVTYASKSLWTPTLSRF